MNKSQTVSGEIGPEGLSSDIVRSDATILPIVSNFPGLAFRLLFGKATAVRHNGWVPVGFLDRMVVMFHKTTSKHCP